MTNIKIFEFNFVAVNTYLLYDETKESVLIDCGCMNQNEEQTLSDFIERNNLQLKRLLCTHLHYDHIVGNAFIHHRYGLEPEAHRADVELLPSARTQMRFMNVFQFSMPDDINITKYLNENDKICFGNSELTIRHVPGHSPGSLAFYNQRDGFVLTGDALFDDSIGRTDLWGGDYDILMASIKDKLLTLPDETVVYPGHGPSTTIIDEKRFNPFLH